MTMLLEKCSIGPAAARSHAADDHSSASTLCAAGLSIAEGAVISTWCGVLQPDYARVWRNLALGYGLLAASATVAAAIPLMSAPPFLAIAIGAPLIGYWIAYLQLFIHEGAHFNLADTREKNDRLCNALIGWIVGTSVAQYRIVHFQHHRALGTIDDSEITFFFPLNLGFLVRTLFGLRLKSSWPAGDLSAVRPGQREARPDGSRRTRRSLHDVCRSCGAWHDRIGVVALGGSRACPSLDSGRGHGVSLPWRFASASRTSRRRGEPRHRLSNVRPRGVYAGLWRRCILRHFWRGRFQPPCAASLGASSLLYEPTGP